VAKKLAKGVAKLRFKKAWKDGTRALVLSPDDLLVRLCAAVCTMRRAECARTESAARRLMAKLGLAPHPPPTPPATPLGQLSLSVSSRGWLSCPRDPTETSALCPTPPPPAVFTVRLPLAARRRTSHPWPGCLAPLHPPGRIWRSSWNQPVICASLKDLNPRSTQRITLAIGQLPLQSTDIPVSVVLSASYIRQFDSGPHEQ
jgi:hypothetical protein